MFVSKVLPFDGKFGRVQGHEIRNNVTPFKQGVQYVLFSTFDQEAQMPVETAVHWTRFTEYVQRKWPHYGSIEAVLMEDGTRIHTTSYTVHFNDEAAWHAAPPICHTPFKITTLVGRTPLLEVVGVTEWSHSKRDAEATAKHLACPWERDNRAFREEIARRTKQGA